MAAFTLLELIAVLVILAVLAVLLIPELHRYRANAGLVTCTANMRAINLGLRSYLLEHRNVWPQGPPVTEGKIWEEFWLESLKKYGIADKQWLCPTINLSLAARGIPEQERPRVHYLPTMFSNEPGIADRWSTQPWLIERSAVHGHGPLIGFPDGSVRHFEMVLAQQGLL
jgi:prepilin-type N-terminal cleavage/methylation domain-containing protein